MFDQGFVELFVDHQKSQVDHVENHCPKQHRF